MQEIEYFYAAHSAFAYLGSSRLSAIANKANRRITHKPMDLRRVMAAANAATFRERTTAHREYFFGREIRRWSEYRNAPVMDGRPTWHDNDIALVNCMLISGIQQGINIDALAHAFLQAHWRDDADLADKETLFALASSVDVDPTPLLEAVDSPQIQANYEANTVEAIKRSVFGSPTYVVDGDMFYGQDHLELVERALKQPFA